MCGACGAPDTGWAERLAPLTPATARVRAAVLGALLAAAPTAGARRAAVTPWHGGGLRLRHPGGWHFAPSLPAAARMLTDRYGPLVPVAAPTQLPEVSVPLASVPLAFGVPAPAAAAWCAAALAAGTPGDGPLTLELDGHTVRLHASSATVRPTPRAPAARPRLTAADPARLARHWESVLYPFRAAVGGSGRLP